MLLTFTGNKNWILLIGVLLCLAIILPLIFLKKYVFYFKAPRTIINEKTFKNLLFLHSIIVLISSIACTYLIKNTSYLGGIIDKKPYFIPIVFLAITIITSLFIGFIIDFIYSKISAPFKRYKAENKKIL